MERKCRPCEGGVDLLDEAAVLEQLKKIPDWVPTDDFKTIVFEKSLKNFSEAVDIIIKIRDIAEREDHHPDLHLTAYKNLRIELMTHAIGGLSQNDFILASEINALF